MNTPNCNTFRLLAGAHSPLIFFLISKDFDNRIYCCPIYIEQHVKSYQNKGCFVFSAKFHHKRSLMREKNKPIKFYLFPFKDIKGCYDIVGFISYTLDSFFFYFN